MPNKTAPRRTLDRYSVTLDLSTNLGDAYTFTGSYLVDAFGNLTDFNLDSFLDASGERTEDVRAVTQLLDRIGREKIQDMLQDIHDDREAEDEL